MAKLDNVTKAKIDFNNSIIQTMENKEGLTVYHLLQFCSSLIDKYNLSENKNYYLFIEYVLSKFNLVTIENSFHIFTRLMSYLTITHDDKAMAVVIRHFFDGKLTLANLIEYSNDAQDFYCNNLGFKKALVYIATR